MCLLVIVCLTLQLIIFMHQSHVINVTTAMYTFFSCKLDLPPMTIYKFPLKFHIVSFLMGCLIVCQWELIFFFFVYFSSEFLILPKLCILWLPGEWKLNEQKFWNSILSIESFPSALIAFNWTQVIFMIQGGGKLTSSSQHGNPHEVVTHQSRYSTQIQLSYNLLHHCDLFIAQSVMFHSWPQ